MTKMVTLAELKTHLRVVDDQHDQKLNQLLTQAIAFVKNYCGRQFTYSTYTEDVDFVNGVGFILESPLSSVASVIDHLGNEYEVSHTSKVCMIHLVNKFTGTLTVTYTGGYSVVPLDLKLAVLQYCEYMWNKPMGVHGTGEAELRTYYEAFDTLTLDMYKVVRI